MKRFSNTASDDIRLRSDAWEAKFHFPVNKTVLFLWKVHWPPWEFNSSINESDVWEGAFMWSMTNQLNYFLLCSKELSLDKFVLNQRHFAQRLIFFTEGTLEILMNLNHFTWGNNRCCICQGNTLKSEQISSILTWGSFSWGTIETLMGCTILSWEDQFDQGTAELLTN